MRKENLLFMHYSERSEETKLKKVHKPGKNNVHSRDAFSEQFSVALFLNFFHQSRFSGIY